jgi:hypothetical protein
MSMTIYEYYPGTIHQTTVKEKLHQSLETLGVYDKEKKKHEIKKRIKYYIEKFHPILGDSKL